MTDTKYPGDAVPQDEALLEAITASPWPTEAALTHYKDRIEQGISPGKRDNMRLVFERNAMIAIHHGQYNGVEGADPAYRYKRLAEMVGARPICELRAETPAYMRELFKQQITQRYVLTYMLTAIERCANIDRGIERYMRGFWRAPALR